ncbi:MAG: class I SAM-dependent methyltransferase, partial [Bacillota bacterium]
MFNTLHKFIILTLTRQGRNHIRLRLAQEVFNPISRKIGYTIVADHFYQPIPNEEEIAFCRNKIRPVVGSIKLSDDRLDFVADLLSEFRHEFNEPSIISSMGYQAECSQIQSGD